MDTCRQIIIENLPAPCSVKTRLCSDITALDPHQWDGMVRDGYPFLRHGFLAGLERHQCVGEHTGWIPHHLCCFDGDRLVGAMPMYAKYNSWGEFVFDHAWAHAFERVGLAYYPKLVNAVPFTPATGQRILAADSRREHVVGALLEQVRALVQQDKFSGLHCLFPDVGDYAVMQGAEMLSRSDCQFHWHNRDYADFEDFLRTLKAKKRKNIRQERRKVTQARLRIQRLDGHTASARDWFDFTRLYHRIYDRKYGAPAFNLAFFQDMAAKQPEQMVLVLAKLDGVCAAGALMYRDKTTLYGRHWGCNDYFDSLHFELCYYQGIEYCIENGLQRFDPGAQGEHKVARGFLPVETRSVHWMADSPFTAAIGQFVERERAGVMQYIAAVKDHSPYLETV